MDGVGTAVKYLVAQVLERIAVAMVNVMVQRIRVHAVKDGQELGVTFRIARVLLIVITGDFVIQL